MNAWMENEAIEQAQGKLDELLRKVTAVRIIFMMPGDIPVWYKDMPAHPGDLVSAKVPEPGDIQIS
jgi:hypothetical protein